MQLPRKPVVAIAGLSCETSTFSPSRTDLAAFHPSRGDEVFTRYPFLQTGTDLGDAADWHCALTAYALPGGAVTRDAFETLSDEIITSLTNLVRTTPLDGLWYDIHGAMCVEGMLDGEAELLRRIRKVIGPDVVVSTSMDLHGNVSQDLAHQTDLITCYRTAPHVDVRETKGRACRNLINLLKNNPGGRLPLPLKAWIPIPILLAGEQTSTRVEPAKHIYAAIPEVEARPGVLDASVWIGYAWADEPRNHAAVVVTGWDTPAVTNAATQPRPTLLVRALLLRLRRPNSDTHVLPRPSPRIAIPPLLHLRLGRQPHSRRLRRRNLHPHGDPARPTLRGPAGSIPHLREHPRPVRRARRRGLRPQQHHHRDSRRRSRRRTRPARDSHRARPRP